MYAVIWKIIFIVWCKLLIAVKYCNVILQETKKDSWHFKLITVEIFSSQNAFKDSDLFAL